MYFCQKKSFTMSRLKYSNKFKARVALDAIREQKTLSELSREYEVSVNQISLWKQEAIRNMELSFAGSKSRKEEAYKDERIKKLQSKVGELTMERDFLDNLGCVRHSPQASLGLCSHWHEISQKPARACPA